MTSRTTRPSGRVIRLLVILSLLLTFIPQAVQPGAVSAQESADADYAVQLVYAVPRGGKDRKLDTDGTILASVASAQNWLSEQTDGRVVNFVEDDGEPTIEYIELGRTEEEIRGDENIGSSYLVEYELRAQGFDEPGMVYAVYYQGEAEGGEVCGATPDPEASPSNSVTLYIEGACAYEDFAGADDNAGWWELTLMHELFHYFGAVARCSPHDDGTGHIRDPHDLMYGEAEPWDYPVQLDVDHDDYYGTGRLACYDTARTPYLTPQQDNVEPYPSAFSTIELGGCVVEGNEPLSERADAEVWITNLSDETMSVAYLDASGEMSELAPIEPWEQWVFTGIPGESVAIFDDSGDCQGGFELPDYDDIGVVWLTSAWLDTAAP